MFVAQSLNTLQEYQNSKATEKFQEQQFAAQELNSQNAAVVSQATLDLRMMKSKEQARQAATEVTRRAARAQATVLAGSSGGGGQALQDVMQSFQVNEAENLGTVQTNLESELLQTELDKGGVRARTRSEIMAATPQPIQRPNLFSAFIGAASSSGAAYYGMK